MTEKIKDRYLTVRLPADVERDLRKHAETGTRTLAAQILHYVKSGLAKETKLAESKASAARLPGQSITPSWMR